MSYVDYNLGVTTSDHHDHELGPTKFYISISALWTLVRVMQSENTPNLSVR